MLKMLCETYSNLENPHARFACPTLSQLALRPPPPTLPCISLRHFIEQGSLVTEKGNRIEKRIKLPGCTYNRPAFYQSLSSNLKRVTMGTELRETLFFIKNRFKINKNACCRGQGHETYP